MKTIFLIFCLTFSALVFGQTEGSVSGTITDLEMNGEPLLYAKVELTNTDCQAQTNLHGNFEMDSVASGQYMLAVSFPGYETLELPIDIEENGTVEIIQGLSAKSLDVGVLLVSELKADSKSDIFARLQR